MEITLSLGMIVFRIIVDRQILVEDFFYPFRITFSAAPDVTVVFRWIWGSEEVPRGELLGRDILLEHYLFNGSRWAFAIAGNGYQSCTRCSPKYDRIDCCLNKVVCSPERVSLATLMRFLPMAAILNHFGVSVFHSSQVKWKERGIVFLAPSGTGKTTQAKLWKKERGAEILCNDRTMIFKRGNRLYTCGYLFDGSEPVYSNQVTELGCIILLRQGDRNEVHRLRAAQAAAGLMSQVQADVWCDETGSAWISCLADLVEKVPVYSYTCTPFPDAVDVLEEKLIKEGVISDGDDS